MAVSRPRSFRVKTQASIRRRAAWHGTGHPVGLRASGVQFLTKISNPESAAHQLTFEWVRRRAESGTNAQTGPAIKDRSHFEHGGGDATAKDLVLLGDCDAIRAQALQRLGSVSAPGSRPSMDDTTRAAVRRPGVKTQFRTFALWERNVVLNALRHLRVRHTRGMRARVRRTTSAQRLGGIRGFYTCCVRRFQLPSISTSAQRLAASEGSTRRIAGRTEVLSSVLNALRHLRVRHTWTMCMTRKWISAQGPCGI
jgi:hypothetical protein